MSCGGAPLEKVKKYGEKVHRKPETPKETIAKVDFYPFWILSSALNVE